VLQLSSVRRDGVGNQGNSTCLIWGFIFMSTITVTFQSAIPFCVLNASSSFAAFHASRARLSNPTQHVVFDSTHCPRCGSYLLHGDGEVRLCRDQKVTMLRKTCHVCDWSSSKPLDRGNVAQFPSARRVRKKQQTLLPVDCVLLCLEWHLKVD
jgi:ribosomal protein S27AE